MSVRIGYQGIEGSNSQEAAIKLALSLSITDAEFLPLVTSDAVVNNLIQKNIDYGVVAFKNNIGGNVNETQNALNGVNYETVKICDMHIHHSVFFKSSDVSPNEITEITSHEQALFQCEQYINLNFPNANRKTNIDTAAAAEQLKNNNNGRNIAVICKKQAGLSRGLYLYEENVEDGESITELRMIKLGQFEPNNDGNIDKKELRKKRLTKFAFGKAFLILLLLSSFAFALLSYFLSSPYYLIASAIIITAQIILLSFRDKTLSELSARNVTGYWKYFPNAVSGMDINQMHDCMRMVRIIQTDGELKLEGWMAGSTKPFFVSSKILCTDNKQKNGKLVYWYNGTVDIRSSASINGVAALEWNAENENKQINKMTGWYLGAASKEIGTLSFTRVSRKEFESFKNERRIIL